MVIVYGLLGLLGGAILNLIADQFPAEQQWGWLPSCLHCAQTRPLGLG